MTLELRVLSGSRAGDRATFDDAIVSVGRHAMSDLRFDPQSELDVSTKHAEFRESGGAWSVTDQDSTNGTFVLGKDGEEAFVRRDSMQIRGEGLIGLGKAPDSNSSQVIRYACEE